MLLRSLADHFSTVNSQLLMASGGDTKLPVRLICPMWVFSPVDYSSSWSISLVCSMSGLRLSRLTARLTCDKLLPQLLMKTRPRSFLGQQQGHEYIKLKKKTISLYSSCLPPPLLFWLFLDINSRGHNGWYFFLKLWSCAFCSDSVLFSEILSAIKAFVMKNNKFFCITMKSWAWGLTLRKK